MRHGRHATLATGCTTVPSRHVGAGPGLIQKHQLRWIETRLPGTSFAPRLLYVGAFLLAGVQGFFKLKIIYPQRDLHIRSGLPGLDAVRADGPD
jgi:hypothetical protein